MNIENRILKVLKDASWGLTVSEIAERAKISRLTASKYLEALKAKDIVIEKKVGAYRLWFLKETMKAERSIISRRLACALAKAFVVTFKDDAERVAKRIGRELVNEFLRGGVLPKNSGIDAIRENPFEMIASLLELLSEGIRAEGIELEDGRGILRITGELCEDLEVVRILGVLLSGAVEGLFKNSFGPKKLNIKIRARKKGEIYEIIIEVKQNQGAA
ncbi:MAG: HTH domain-containing protein [Candidatus Njordarchaeia archaeon]